MTQLLVGFRFAPYSATPLLAVRHAAEVVERDGNWFESFAPDCWLARGKNAQVQWGHNSTVIGSVNVVVPGRDGWWHADGLVDTDHLADDTVVLERIKVGSPISVGFDPIHHDDDLHLRLRRHDLAELRHIAVLRRGEIPAFAGAKIISVSERKTKPVVDPWDAPPPTLDELGPLTEANALDHWTARIELGEDPDAAILDIKRKLAKKAYDPRLGRRTNIQPSGAGGKLVRRETLVRNCGTILRIT